MKILTIGDNNIDTYASGMSYSGGNCPNVAAYAALNGWASAYIGVVGKDNFGNLSIEGLKAVGVDTSHMRREEGRTSRDVIVLKNGDRVFTQYDRSIIDAFPLKIREDEIPFAKSFDLIHTSIYSTFAEEAFEELCSLGVPVSYDFSVEWESSHMENSSDEYLAELKPVAADFLEKTCARIDYGFFSCSHLSDSDTRKLLARVSGYGLKLAVATRGMHGSWCYDGKQYYHQQAYPVPVVDTLGAGDSFITKFLLSYMEGMHWFRACLSHLPADTCSAKTFADYQGKLISLSMSQAALFASRSCQLEGAFGHGKKLV